MEYPSTPKQFNLFQDYKNVEHDGNMLTADQRTKVYEDRSKVIAEMAESFYIFSRSIFFNPEMADQYTLSRDKYFNYFSQIIQNINIFLLDQPEMYHDRIAMSNMSKPPTPRGSTTPVTMAMAFCLIEKMPAISTGAQTMQVLNLLHKSPSTSGSIIRRPTPMRIVDQPVDKSESSVEQTQDQPVTPVSFASTTQVRIDIAVPSPVGQGVAQIPPVLVPLSQITSVASTTNIAVSMASQQLGTSVTTQPQQQAEQCRKCGKKNHPISDCCQNVTCRKCKGKDHSTKFCSAPNQGELKCTFCEKLEGKKES